MASYSSRRTCLQTLLDESEFKVGQDIVIPKPVMDLTTRRLLADDCIVTLQFSPAHIRWIGGNGGRGPARERCCSGEPWPLQYRCMTVRLNQQACIAHRKTRAKPANEKNSCSIAADRPSRWHSRYDGSV